MLSHGLRIELRKGSKLYRSAIRCGPFKNYPQGEISSDKISVVKPAERREKRKRPNQEKKTKFSRFTSSSYVNQLLSGKQCCSKNCLTTVLACEEIEECLNLFWEKMEEEQRAFILDYLYFNKSIEDSGKVSYQYKVNGEKVFVMKPGRDVMV